MKSSKSPTMPNFTADSSFPIIFPSQPKYYIRSARQMQEGFSLSGGISGEKGKKRPRRSL